MKKLVPLLLSGVLLFCAESCKRGSGNGGEQTQHASQAEDNSFPREKTLYIVGFEDSDPASFNPLNDWPAWPIRPEFNLMYEHLVAYNSMNGQIEPELASYEGENDDFVSVLLNPAAKWSDGKALTGEDVEFSFMLGIKYPSLPSSYVGGFLSGVTTEKVAAYQTKTPEGLTVYRAFDKTDSAVTADTVMVERIKLMVDKAGRNNPLVLVDLLSSITILPKHVFADKLAAVEDVSELQEIKMDKMSDHVVSGPYMLHAYSNEKIVIKRREDYWGNAALHDGKKPAPEYIIHPIYKTNDAANSALKHGELDVSSNFMPRIWLKKKRGVSTWYDSLPYYVAGSIPMFVINTTKKPLDDKNFRRAIAMSIDYEKVQRLALSGYTPNINGGLILPFSEEKKYFNQAEVDKYSATKFDTKAAKALLEKSGYKSYFKVEGKDTVLDYTTGPDGQKLPTMYIKSPTGWSDFESIIKLSVKTMRQAGIDIREGLVDASLYWPAQHSGDFDLLMDTPCAKLTASMPWARFETLMSSMEWAPIGEKMYVNYGRFNNPNDTKSYIPEINKLLTEIPHMTDEAAKAEAYRKLNQYFMEEQPTIPLAYRPEEFYQFNNKHWTNFATMTNPYAPPLMPVGGAGTKMLWNIKPTAAKEGK